MRKNNLSKLFTGILALIALSGCKEEYTPIENRIYFNEAAHVNVQKLPVNVGQKTQTNFTVRMADLMSSDVHATIKIDETLLTEYNQKMNTTYTLLPSGSYSFADEVVIERGKTMASPTIVTIEPYEAAEGVKYAIPFRLVSNGSVKEEVRGAQYILLLDKPWTQATPYLNSRGGFKTEGLKPINLEYFTIEFWLWMDNFQYNNQCIIDCGAFYIRLGNANNQITKDQMQINVFGTKGENIKGFFNNFTFQRQTWTHVAMVYDQTKCHFYVNGTKVQDVEGTGVPATISTITFFNDNTINAHMMGQARLWNRVLTQSEIQTNMGGPVTVTDDLVGYWKMDEGEGTTIKDSSKNENHATLASGTLNEWRPGQCFINPN